MYVNFSMGKFNEKKIQKKILYVLNALNIHKTYYNIHNYINAKKYSCEK